MPDGLLPKLEAYIKARDPQGSVTLENNDTVVKFSMMGAPQQVKLQYVPQNSWTIAYTAHLPGAKELWFLESKWVWFPEHSGCKRIQVAPLDARFKMYASDAAYFGAVFSSHDLTGLLLLLPPENHFKSSLQDGALKLAWKMRFDPRMGDRDGILLNCADVMVRLGVQCFKSVQVARLSRGEQTKFSE
jgi:hypothetical protein